jgi:hypothetical protein
MSRRSRKRKKSIIEKNDFYDYEKSGEIIKYRFRNEIEILYIILAVITFASMLTCIFGQMDARDRHMDVAAIIYFFIGLFYLYKGHYSSSWHQIDLGAKIFSSFRKYKGRVTHKRLADFDEVEAVSVNSALPLSVYERRVPSPHYFVVLILKSGKLIDFAGKETNYLTALQRATKISERTGIPLEESSSDTEIIVEKSNDEIEVKGVRLDPEKFAADFSSRMLTQFIALISYLVVFVSVLFISKFLTYGGMYYW